MGWEDELEITEANPVTNWRQIPSGVVTMDGIDGAQVPRGIAFLSRFTPDTVQVPPERLCAGPMSLKTRRIKSQQRPRFHLLWGPC